MSRYFIKGKLTIRASLYLNAILISLVMGFSAPITTVYFLSHINAELVPTFAIVATICGIIVSYIKQSKVAIRWISDNFVPFMLVCQAMFFILAFVGEAHPEIRYIWYNLVCIFGIKLLKVVRKDNIVNCLHGTSIISFNSVCDTLGLIGSMFGASICTLILMYTNISVTIVMLIECTGCFIGHLFQAYANKRIKEDIRTDLEKYSFIDVINDISRVNSSKKRKSEDSDDSIFDQ